MTLFQSVLQEKATTQTTYFSIKAHVVGTQGIRLIETVVLGVNDT